MKINITIDNGIDIKTAIERIYAVVKQGRISNDGNNFCYGNSFNDGTFVYAFKTRAGNDSFRVFKE